MEQPSGLRHARAPPPGSGQLRRLPLRQVGALAAALAACRAAPIVEADRWPPADSLSTRRLMVAGTDLRVIDTGTGPAVVFIHGLGGSAYTWRFALGPIVAAGHRVIAFDNRGFGFSERPPAGYANHDYATLVVALLDSLRLEQVVLVGHSMGGAIAAEVALAWPERVRGLVLIGSAGVGVAEPWTLRLVRLPLVGRLLTAFRGRWVVRQLLRSTYADPTRVSDADVGQYYAPTVLPGSIPALRRVLREFRFDALTGRLRHVQVPTLLLWGSQDRWIPVSRARQMALELPLGALVVLPDAGHNVHEEQPEAVSRTLLDFLREGLPRAPVNLADARWTWAPAHPLQSQPVS